MSIHLTNLNKKQRKRWGKKFIDRRDWHAYNEELVRVGEYMLDMDWVESWDDELVLMNKRKVGAPYKFPKSLIELQAVWHAKSYPFRSIEGMTRDLCKIGQLPDYNDYSTVNRRMNQLDYSLAVPKGESIAVFSDGTGLQAVAGGEYLREKYGKKNRRWVQVIILGDPLTKEPVSYEVTSSWNQKRTAPSGRLKICSPRKLTFAPSVATALWTRWRCGTFSRSKASHQSSSQTKTHSTTPTMTCATSTSKNARNPTRNGRENTSTACAGQPPKASSALSNASLEKPSEPRAKLA